MTGRPTTDDIQQLRDADEQKAGRRMHTPKDFDYLRERIYEECHEMVSISTLKRLWGYDRYEGTPRVSSLNPIARYVGYSDWDDYLQHAVVNEEQTDQPEQDAQEIKENTPHSVILSPTYILAATFFMAVVIGGIALLKRFSSGEQTASSVEDTIPPSGQRVLRKGQDCFHTIDDYLALFGIEARDTAYFCPLPGNRDVYVWGPEYQHPVWHNEGDTSQLLPTITEYWTPLSGEQEYQNAEYVKLGANEKLNYERLEKDELRITFMKNIVDGFYVFLGIYRMDKEHSTKEKTVWKRISDQCDLGNLDKMDLLRNY